MQLRMRYAYLRNMRKQLGQDRLFRERNRMRHKLTFFPKMRTPHFRRKSIRILKRYFITYLEKNKIYDIFIRYVTRVQWIAGVLKRQFDMSKVKFQFLHECMERELVVLKKHFKKNACKKDLFKPKDREIQREGEYVLKFLEMVDTKSDHFLEMCNMYVKRQRMTFLLEHMCAHYCKQKVLSDQYLKQDDKENIAKGREIRDNIQGLLFRIKDQRV